MTIDLKFPSISGRAARTWLGASAAVIGLALTGPALADHPSVGVGTAAAGPVTTIPATPMPAGGWALGVRSELIEFDHFSDQELEDFAAAGLEAHSVDQIRAHSVSLGYGLTQNLSVFFRLPFIQRDDVREGELEGMVPEAHLHGDAEGLGDLTLLGLYRFLEQENAGFDAAVLAGIKIPTGKTTDEDRDGIEFETEFQPGSGSWDPMLGLAASKRIGAYAFDANVLYIVSQEGARQTDLGDAFSYNAALSYRLGAGDHDHHAPGSQEHGHSSWDLILELNGERRQQESISGLSDSHSGGNIVYVAPGVRFTSAGNWAAFASFGVPIIDNPNGIQTDTSYRVIAGAGFSF